MAVSSEIVAPATWRWRDKGDVIRAKIAANRAKRLRIADAMKKEAGVTAHTVNKEDLGGHAYIGTGGIYSPEGRKIVQLYTLAHECGHIFLHNSGPGYALPSHVKEFEAESYAHQAFREHGMNVPRRLSNWGRQYVASCIDKDRAANIQIDPRAIAYAAGRLSPYEPLRMVPATWEIFRASVGPAAPTIAVRWPYSLRAAVNRALQRLGQKIPKHLREEALTLFRLVAGCTFHGTTACLFGLVIIQHFHPMPDVFPGRPGDIAPAGEANFNWSAYRRHNDWYRSGGLFGGNCSGREVGNNDT
jgi:hypothetical protein